MGGGGGVLVPDPCLSGAAMFTVRKEAVNCVCSHLSKKEQLLSQPPPPQVQGQGETRVQDVGEDWKSKGSETGSFPLPDSIRSVSGRSDGPPLQGPAR